MFKLLRFKNIRTKISLLLPVTGMALSIGMCFLLPIGYIQIVAVFFTLSVLAAANYSCIPMNDYLKKNEMLKYYLSRFFYYTVLYALIMLACSLGINMISDAILGTIFANVNPFIGEVINETLLFLASLIILSKIVIYNGYSDTTHKRYNSHITLASMISAFALVFPFLFADYVYYLMDGDVMFSSGFVTSRSHFLPVYLSSKLNLGLAGVIIGFLIQSALGIIVMLYYYSEGRRNFFVKHPHDLDYDKEQIDSYIKKS